MGTLCVTNLGKAYKVYPGRFARLKEWLLPFGKQNHTTKWVLKDLSFTINQGESVGIIGVNGAGKSTLLKMLTGTTQPTTGSVETTGRVAALLELGMGFHPEFTGRQNVYMGGQLLGMSVEEIRDFMPQIEAFAEIGDYIDRPVRVYSSGMQMRLAFSVATVRRPDILIVDEALSVGDVYFQHKSFERIRQFRAEGTTLLIVSHDKQAIQSICDRALLLDGGGLAKEGGAEEVMDYYNALIAERDRANVRLVTTGQGRVQTVSGTGEARIQSVALENGQGEPVACVIVGEKVTLRVSVEVCADIPELVLGYLIKDQFGQSIFGTNTYHLGSRLECVKKGQRLEFCFSFSANLGQGSYSVAIALHASYSHLAVNYEWRDCALVFSVVNTTFHEFTGSAWLPQTMEIRHVR